jgi:putative intracellular protease/amidase
VTSTEIEVLLVLTSQASMGDDPGPAGLWPEELTTPYFALIDAGAEVDIASIAGGKIPSTRMHCSQQARTR